MSTGLVMTPDTEVFDLAARAAIAKLLRVDVERLKPSASLADDLKVDSLEFIALIVGLERHFDVSLPDVEAAKVQTVSEITYLLRMQTESAGRVVNKEANSSSSGIPRSEPNRSSIISAP
jgi:acyl carrier protein